MGLAAYIYDFVVMSLFGAIGLFVGYIVAHIILRRDKAMDRKLKRIEKLLYMTVSERKKSK
jgi:hypothetical protein